MPFSEIPTPMQIYIYIYSFPFLSLILPSFFYWRRREGRDKRDKGDGTNGISKILANTKTHLFQEWYNFFVNYIFFIYLFFFVNFAVINDVESFCIHKEGEKDLIRTRLPCSSDDRHGMTSGIVVTIIPYPRSCGHTGLESWLMNSSGYGKYSLSLIKYGPARRWFNSKLIELSRNVSSISHAMLMMLMDRLIDYWNSHALQDILNLPDNSFDSVSTSYKQANSMFHTTSDTAAHAPPMRAAQAGNARSHQAMLWPHATWEEHDRPPKKTCTSKLCRPRIPARVWIHIQISFKYKGN